MNLPPSQCSQFWETLSWSFLMSSLLVLPPAMLLGTESSSWIRVFMQSRLLAWNPYCLCFHSRFPFQSFIFLHIANEFFSQCTVKIYICFSWVQTKIVTATALLVYSSTRWSLHRIMSQVLLLDTCTQQTLITSSYRASYSLIPRLQG